jgi:hypothetical protein
MPLLLLTTVLSLLCIIWPSGAPSASANSSESALLGIFCAL